MSTPVRTSDRDLRALAAIVSRDRPDLAEGEGLPPSLLADLMGQIRCDEISFESHDSRRRETRLLQIIPVALIEDIGAAEDRQPAHWQHYWDCQPCSHPDRTGDLRSIIKPRTSTQRGNGIPPACTAISTGRRSTNIH